MIFLPSEFFNRKRFHKIFGKGVIHVEAPHIYGKELVAHLKKYHSTCYCITPVNYDYVRQSFGCDLSKKEFSDFLIGYYKRLVKIGIRLQPHVHVSVDPGSVSYKEKKRLIEGAYKFFKNDLKIDPSEIVYGWTSFDSECLTLSDGLGMKNIPRKHFHIYDFWLSDSSPGEPWSRRTVNMPTKKPNLFIVGVARSGTTSLYEWLKLHPDVYMSEVKGPNFFGNEINEAFPEFHKNEKNYLKLFAKADSEKVLGEASHYFLSKSAPKEIKKFNPESKIVVLLRNPLDVVNSYYKSGSIPNSLPFEDAIRLKGPKVARMWEELKFSRNLNNYLKVFGKKRVHIIIFDDLVSGPQEAFNRICDFLEIKRFKIDNFEAHNASREIKNKWFLLILEKCPPSIKLFLKSLLPKDKIKRMRDSVVSLTTKKEVKTKVPSGAQEYLKRKFHAEILKTSKLIGRDLTRWTR